MPVYYTLSPKNLRVLLCYILIREPVKERTARDRERRTSSIKKQGLLLAFFRL
jgi:hypothetical protein